MQFYFAHALRLQTLFLNNAFSNYKTSTCILYKIEKCKEI